MKKILLTCVISVTFSALSLNAWAGGPHDRYDHRPNDRQYHHFHDRYHGSAHRAPNWVAPLVVLGLAGAAISATANAPPQASVTYSTLPLRQVPLSPPVHASYFCSSVGQFYPYTSYCPEGWQLVIPGR